MTRPERLLTALSSFSFVLVLFVGTTGCGSSGNGGASSGNDASVDAPVTTGDATADTSSPPGDSSTTPDSSTPLDAGAADSGGGGGGCTDAATCAPPPVGPCASLGAATCIAGACGVTYTPGPAPSQLYGKCHQNVCDANGVMTSTVDTVNTYSNGNQCTTFTCSSSGMVVATALPGTSCTLMGSVMGYCEPNAETGFLACATCNPADATSCNGVPGTRCASNGSCLPMHCFDSMKDVGETDVDCGGTTSGCLPCGTARSCAVATDCLGDLCTASTCPAPSCSDHVKNGTESDVDCGGQACTACAAGSACLVPPDCTTGVCRSSGGGAPNTCQAPTCTDGIQNGSEMGVDCGGTDGAATCPPCGDGGV